MTKIVVANDKGGVGKSLLAQFCVLALRGAGRDPVIMEFDRQPKLGRLFGAGAVVTRSAAPELGEQLDDAAAAAAFFDAMVEPLTDGRDLVVDFGAQVWSAFGQWARLSGLAALSPGAAPLVLVPFTADMEAVRGAARVVREAAAIWPRATTVLLALDKDGAVAHLAGVPDYDALAAAAARGEAGLRSFPVLRAEGYAGLAARGLRVDEIAAGDPRALDVASLGVAAAARTQAAARGWMAEMYRQLLPLLLLSLHGSPQRKAAGSPRQAGGRVPAPPASPPRPPADIGPEYRHMLADLPKAGTRPRVDARLLSTPRRRESQG